ncbi:CTD small phosphatase-like protein [Thelohanellus kitauei]|uniref:CTD small phosphatase-like protein n=1 Tax=Thelohanellus kitauei TaxID=669202 RepID=A0A0C2MNK0_THEKT|nr:CTD small phosphatase-like protein [Thelohanellus kitauei]
MIFERPLKYHSILRDKIRQLFQKREIIPSNDFDIPFLSLDEAVLSGLNSMSLYENKEEENGFALGQLMPGNETYESYEELKDEEIVKFSPHNSSFVKIVHQSKDYVIEIIPPPRSFLVDAFLPKNVQGSKQCLVVDLDETLIHSALLKPLPYSKPDYEFTLEIKDEAKRIYLYCRPFLQEFLAYIKTRYECVIFTAGIEIYADVVLDYIDPDRVFTHRLYRSSCSMSPFGLVKDLRLLGRKLDRVVIIDNTPMSYILQAENAIPIKSWDNTCQKDDELFQLVKFLDLIGTEQDLVTSLKHHRARFNL